MDPEVERELVDIVKVQLREKEREVQKLERELANAHRELKTLEARLEHAENGWMVPVPLPREQVLPVPRLELVLKIVNAHKDLWLYRLVHSARDGDIIGLPLAQTSLSYGFADRDSSPVDTDEKRLRYDAKQLRLPAYIIQGEKVTRVDEPPRDKAGWVDPVFDPITKEPMPDSRRAVLVERLKDNPPKRPFGSIRSNPPRPSAVRSDRGEPLPVPGSRFPPFTLSETPKPRPVSYKPIPDYGDKMTVEDFQGCVNVGGFTPDDGHGYYASEHDMSDINCFETLDDPELARSLTHVIWFNK